MEDLRIASFLDRLTADDNRPPFSDAKVEQLAKDGPFVTICEDEEIIAMGVAADHRQPDGSLHWAVETALVRGMRFPEFEDRLLVVSLELVPDNDPFSVWSHRESLGSALERRGFVVARSLGHLIVDLPLVPVSDHTEYRTFAPADVSAVVDLNRRAFGQHREASSLDEPELVRLLDVPGLGPEGLLLIEDAGGLAGFCWTRVHQSGDGEIFRIAIDPDRQGEGLGREILLAGFTHLSTRDVVERGTLWVDLADERAMALYESVGMTVEWVNREYEPGA